MQHFHITYPHRWTTPQLTIATKYSLRDMHGERVKYDYAHYLIFEIHKGKRSLEHTCNSKAMRPQPMYLGGVLVLTQIVYFAMGELAQLPPPLHIPQGITPRHITRPLALDKTLRVYFPPKKTPQGPQHKEGTRRITGSNVQKFPMMPRSSPITSSSFDQEAEEYKVELRSQVYPAKFNKQMEVV